MKKRMLHISPYMELKYLKNTLNQRTLNARVFDATDIGEEASSRTNG